MEAEWKQVYAQTEGTCTGIHGSQSSSLQSSAEPSPWHPFSVPPPHTQFSLSMIVAIPHARCDTVGIACRLGFGGDLGGLTAYDPLRLSSLLCRRGSLVLHAGWPTRALGLAHFSRRHLLCPVCACHGCQGGTATWGYCRTR